MAKKVLILLLLFTITLCSVIDVNSSEELLQWLCNSSLNDSSVIVFNKASYTLNVSTSFCIIQNLTNITLRSMTGHSSIKCTSKSAGFGFVNITNITVTSIGFNGCGTTLTEEAVVLINDTHPHIGYLQKAVLLFNHCHNINISHVNISYYSGYAIMIMNPIGYSTLYGVIVIYGLGSNHESCLHDDTFSCTGSGIMCVFKDTHVIPKYSTVKVELINLVVNYSFNVIHGIPPLEDIGPKVCYLPLIGAAGLSLLFNQSYKVTFLCGGGKTSLGNTCTLAFCHGTVAGNMLILYTNGMYNSQTIIAHSLIAHGFLNKWRNSEMSQVIGSGITVLSVLCGTCHAVHNYNSTWIPLNIMKSTVAWNGNNGYKYIKSNRVHYGGGIYLNILDACGPKFIIIKINNKFYNNYAYISGSNIYAFVSQNIKKSKDIDISLVLMNFEVSYTNVKAILILVPSITLINWNNVIIDGGWFHDNNSTVIAAYNSEVFMTGNMTFYNNRGTKGAALFLKFSHLILQEPLNATFTENSALLYGGAVYIDSSIISKEKSRCGMQIKVKNQKIRNLMNLEIYLNFKDNTAGLAGKSLYINCLYNCSMFSQQISNSQNFKWKSIMNFVSNKSVSNGIKEVSSEPVKICTCNFTYMYDCSGTNKKLNNIFTYPGMVIQLSLCAVDVSGSIVYSSAVCFYCK